MNALPTRTDEAFRYADLAALGEVWDGLGAPETIEIAAQQKVQQIWVPNGDAIAVRRAEIRVAAGGQFNLLALNHASRYARIELDVTLAEGADFSFSAANLATDKATVEIVTTVRHAAPNATSRQIVRAIAGTGGTVNYLGKVAVARGADGTDSEQSVKAMLLDRGSVANAKPELEIYADDVKCAHGATVGELDRQQLFYAMSRGMDPAAARAMLLGAFVGGLWDALGEDSEIAAMTRDAVRGMVR